MALTDTQAAFLRKHLGVGESATAPVVELSGKPLEIWNDAKEEADRSISALQSALKGLKDPHLDRIAEFGLNGVSQGNQVGITRSLMAYDAAAADRRAGAAKTLVDQIGAYRSMLDGNALIALCEKNPFGVQVAIRAPLRQALDRIERIVTA